MEDPKTGEGRYFSAEEPDVHRRAGRSDDDGQAEVEGHRQIARSEDEESEGEGLRRRSGEAPEVEGHRMRSVSEGPERLS